MLYLIGVPGAGKTTLLARALEGVPCTPVAFPFAHRRYPGGILLGAARAGGFGGTDALPMSVQPKVLAWLAGKPPPAPVVVAEGDRLANDSFFHAVRALGWDLCVLALDLPPGEAAARRVARAAALGTRPQNPRWLKGRETKVTTLAARYCPPEFRLDATLPLELLIPILRTHPMLAALCQPAQLLPIENGDSG